MKQLLVIYILPCLLCLFVHNTQAQGGHQFRFNAQYGWMQHSKMGSVFAGPEWAFGKGNHQVIFGATFGYAEGNRNLSKEAMEKGGLLYGYPGAPRPPFLVTTGIESEFPGILYRFQFPKSSTSHQLGGRLGYQYQHFTEKLHFSFGGGWYLNYVSKQYIATILEDVVIIDDLFVDFFPSEQYVIDLDIQYWVRYLHTGPFVQGHVQLARSGSVQPGFSVSYHHGFGGIGWVSAGLQVAFGM